MTPGFIPLLAVLFIGLKLGGVIAWAWLWVLAPLWIPVAAWLAICVGMLSLAGMLALSHKLAG